MAEFLFTFVVEQLLEKLGSIAIEEIAGPFRLKEDLQNLRELTESIQGKVQTARNNEAAYGKTVRPLLVKLQAELYKAEDVLDEFSYEILCREVKIQRQPCPRICGFASPSIPILFRVKMARKVKRINQSLADIENQGLREIAFTGKAVTDSSVVSNDQLDQVSVSFPDKLAPPVIGRTKEVKAIIDMLQVSSSTPSLLTIISIVGFGGLGKTTLAKMVLDQVKERKLVDKTIWVCVSQAFNITNIFKGMLETLDESAGGLTNLDAILQHIKKKMEDQRFLFVLDDVWEEDREKCNSLKSDLLNICGRAGNFVIVTTRNLGVARALDTEDEHLVQLKKLEKQECWEIIKNKCVKEWKRSMPKELEEIGVDIAEKCGGVPLVAKVLGGTLCEKNNKEKWLSIRDSDSWEQKDEENKIFPVLKLSFDQLDPSLKQCFVYCSLFPKNFVYDKEMLIELWMAEGFLNTTSKSMEVVGDECYIGLLFHSFFQTAQVDRYGC